jgi:hypothetical protein
MHQTKSENAFEQFLTRNNVSFERIQTAGEPRPDFIVYLGEQSVIFELKEVATNEDNSFSPLKVRTKTQGEKIRNAIQEASKQMRWANRQGCPSVLLLTDVSSPGIAWHLEDQDFSTAMYGEITVVLGKKTNKITDQFNGKNEKLTALRRTHFSALGRMLVGGETADFTIFPNIFADIPINLLTLPMWLKVVRIEIENPC